MPATLARTLRALPLLCIAFAAQDGHGLTVGAPHRIAAEQIYSGAEAYPPATHALKLAFAYFPAAGWQVHELVAAARVGARVLAQCRVRIAALELVALDDGARYHDFHTPVSRELARRVPLARPTVYFVADTRQRPAFDAEAIGRGNSRTRPELADTVWITRAARDLGIVLAHELTHVLLDSGAHSAAEANLMREETAPANTRLDPEQCDRLRAVGTAHGLLEETEGKE